MLVQQVLYYMLNGFNNAFDLGLKLKKIFLYFLVCFVLHLMPKEGKVRKTVGFLIRVPRARTWR